MWLSIFTCFNHPIFPIWGWLPTACHLRMPRLQRRPSWWPWRAPWAWCLDQRSARLVVNHPWDSTPKMVDFTPDIDVIGDEKAAGYWSTLFLDKLGICCTFYAYLGLWTSNVGWCGVEATDQIGFYWNSFVTLDFCVDFGGFRIFDTIRLRNTILGHLVKAGP